MRRYTVLPSGNAKSHINMLLVGWWFGFVLEPQDLNTSQSWRPWTQGEAICLTVKAGLNPISANLQRSSLKSKESTCCGGPRSRTQLKCCAWINPHKSKLTETIQRKVVQNSLIIMWPTHPKFDMQHTGSSWHIKNVPGEQSTLSPATEAALLYVLPGVAVKCFMCSGIFSQVNAHAVKNTSGDDLQMID